MIEFVFGISIESLIASGGLLTVGLIIFAEGGLLAGFFLPGDTLLLSAGYFASTGKLPLGWLLGVIVISGIIGDNTGYEIGSRMGKRLFKKEEGIFFHRDQLKRADVFYEKHGVKTVLFARFIPIVRTFAPVVAGASSMSRKQFALFNAIGVATWGISITLLGYYLGRIIGARVANIDKYILLVIGVAMLITIGPAVYHLIKSGLGKKSTPQE